MKNTKYIQQSRGMDKRSSAFSGKKLTAWSRLAGALVFLLLSQSLIHGHNNRVLSSPNPKVNPAFTLSDVVQLSASDVFDLKANLAYGLKGTFDYSSSETDHNGKITLSVWLYDPREADGKYPTCLYKVFIDQTHTANFNKRTYGVTINSELKSNTMITIQSDQIARIITSKQLNSQDGCAERSLHPWWGRLSKFVSDVFNSVNGSDVLNPYDDCVRRYDPHLPVIVEVEYSGNGTKAFTQASVPGIGALELQTKGNTTIVNVPLPNLDTYCTGNSSDYCTIYSDIRNPQNPNGSTFKENIYVACHRGKWGQPLSGGRAENTLEAVQDAEAIAGYNSKLIEMDVTQIAGGKLVFLHDYVMSRLTSYSGDKYSFEMGWHEMQKYNVRLRDGSQSTSKVTAYTDMVAHMRDNNHFLMLDIKEKQAKMKGTECKANCAFITPESQDASWTSIAKKAIQQAQGLGASHNIIIKTYRSAVATIKLLGNQNSKSTFWTPIIVSNAPQWKTNGQADIQKMCDFVDEWQSILGNYILCFETDFFTPSDVQLQSFSRTKGGVTTTYQNLPHYIYATTGRRSGIFSEDPASSKGTVNRWGDWKMKNTSSDRRGDFLWLSKIPYGKIFLVTTDRPDVWNSIKTELKK